MKASLIILLVLFLLSIGAFLYLYFLLYLPDLNTLQSLKAENETWIAQNQNLTDKVSELDIEVNGLQEQIKELSKAKEQKEAEIDTLKGTYQKLVLELQDEIKKGQIKITQLAGKLSLNVADKILFKSGQSEITPNGLKILKRVGDILKEAKDKKIRVEGHTDNAPIGAKLKTKYPTNWELSTARATNVVRYLQEQVGIDGKRLEAIGLAEYHPISSNKTKSGRAKNRRIEIKLIPIVDE